MTFGPCERDHGKYDHGRQWQGAFVDVLSLAYALDADRGASFAEHRVNFGLPPVNLPVAVTAGADGAAEMAEAVTAVHELAVTLDEHASRWFTTSQDRVESRGRLDLVRTFSPGGTDEQVTIVAFDPGYCGGAYVYQAVEWYFPGEGQSINPNSGEFNGCTGQ